MIRRQTQGDCPDDGELRRMLGPDARAGRTADHVARCERCHGRLEAMLEASTTVDVALRALGDGTAPRPATEAYARFRARIASLDEHSINDFGGMTMGGFRAGRVARSMAAGIVLIAVMAIISFSPIRTVASDFLSQFRVQKFAAVTIPMSMIDPMQSVLLTEMSDEDIEQLKSEFDQLGSFESTFDMDALPEAVTIDEARATYGTFAVPDDLPQGFDAQPEVFVTQAGTGAYTLNVARAHELVEELHLPIYSLPDRDAYPTVTFTMDVPSAVILTYSGADGEMLAVGQMESPSLSIPDSVDMNALREEILRFPGLPPDFVAELRSIDDWEHTLVIPVPENATSRDVTVHGRPGLLIESSEGSVVFWERGGMLYAVGGNITGPQALDVADSMQ